MTDSPNYSIEHPVNPYRHRKYVLLPLFGAIIWFGTLWAMLIVWLASGRPRYISQDQSIAYISDVGADILKPLFIAGSSVTAACFVLSLCVERLFRHVGRLLPNMRQRERILGILAILGAAIGGCGLILLSVLDTKRFPTQHRIFLLVFMVGVALSGIFTLVEYLWLSKSFAEARKLKYAYIAKAIIVSILICLSIAFAVALFQSSNAGAVLEWTIAFGFTFYLLTFVYDLRLSKGIADGELTREKVRDNPTLVHRLDV